MGKFELASDFVINNTLKPHIDDDFRVVSPGLALHHDPTTNEQIHPRILVTGSGSAVQEPLIFEKLIAMTGKDCPNVVYIGTPFFDREDKYEAGTLAFRKIGCRIKRLMVAKECTTPSIEEMRRIVVDWPDLIVVSGGNSLFAMLRWQSIGLDLLIRDAAIKGTVLCGGSAGCGCFFDSMQTDSLKPEACKLGEKVLAELSAEERLNWSFVRITCLGFINAFCIPHIDTVGTNNIARVDIAKKMILEAHQQDLSRPIVGLGVDEKAGIVYVDGKLSIYSAGPRATGVGQATCHILFVDGNLANEVMSIPITADTDEAVALDELIERAVRSVAALSSPIDLIVSKDVTDACHTKQCSTAFDIDLIAAGGDLGMSTEEQSSQPNQETSSPPTAPPPPSAPLKDHAHARSLSLDSFVKSWLLPAPEMLVQSPRPSSAHARSKTRV